LEDLRAVCIAVPPFESKYLRRGHAIHFRCQHPDAFRMRVDVMSKMRGVDSFGKLWRRRTTIEMADKTVCELISLPDLVRAKKTQRDKDWPMVRRLVEADYFQNFAKPNTSQIKFWSMELRTPTLLIDLGKRHSALVRKQVPKRNLLVHALSGRAVLLERALLAEETSERTKDKLYWAPLWRELEQLRHPDP